MKMPKREFDSRSEHEEKKWKNKNTKASSFVGIAERKTKRTSKRSFAQDMQTCFVSDADACLKIPLETWQEGT